MCIYVRSNLNYIIRDGLSSDNLECLIIEITNPHSKPFQVESPNARKLKDIFDVYGLHQLILEATRVTPLSQTLIDLCITNSPLNIVKTGVVQLSISDHALVYMTRKARY